MRNRASSLCESEISCDLQSKECVLCVWTCNNRKRELSNRDPVGSMDCLEFANHS
jgi:hypothetical protein